VKQACNIREEIHNAKIQSDVQRKRRHKNPMTREYKGIVKRSSPMKTVIGYYKSFSAFLPNIARSSAETEANQGNCLDAVREGN